ncbi:MAG TPA: PLP-dependent aminotransferase family protein [Symbiobacteriaceae bacterium]|nr:PLP-dependent aminotransferase family protein [Symbiobacteriaceae bacterium]
MRVRFRAIVADLADQIHRGALPPGTRLPTERALATELGVNRSTVTEAFAELEAHGLVERRQGSGTFVRGDLWGVAPDWQRYINGGAFHPTAPLLQRIRAARRNPGIVDLSAGVADPALLPTALVQELVQSLTVPDLGYPHPMGELRLREAITHLLQHEHGITADPESILITTGAQQALYLITRALLSPGDAVGIEQPSYCYSLSLFQSAGVRLLPLPVDQDGVDPGLLQSLYQRNRLRMVLVNPTCQNPTGTVLPEPRRRQLLAVCRSLNIPVVEDDTYGLLHLDGAAPPPLKALDREGRVLYLGTLSKTTAPGLRLGWLTGPKPVIERLADVKQQMDIGTNALAQWVAAELLESAGWRSHLAAMRAELKRRRDHFAARLQTIFGDGMGFRLPVGGLNLWARWDHPGDDRQRLEAAIQAGVLVAPGRLYGAQDGWVRLTFALVGRAATDEALQRLRKAGA